MAFIEGAALVSQFRRSGNSCIGHGKANIVAEGDGIGAAVGKAHLDEHVAEAHDAQADLAPGFDAFPLFFQGMQGQAFFEDVIQSPYATRTQRLNSSKSKVALGEKGLLTKLARFMLPNRQEPPAGKGSSAQGLTPAKENSGV